MHKDQSAKSLDGQTAQSLPPRHLEPSEARRGGAGMEGGPPRSLSGGSSPAGCSELYVGYLPVPPTYLRFLRTAAPVLAMLFVAGAVAWAISYRSPGTGVWDTAQVREFTGVIHARPYAMIHTTDVDGSPRSMLLVQEGKHGAAEIGAAFDGKQTRVRGFVLERDGHRILELSGSPERVVSDASMEMDPSLRCEPAGRVTLRGEIIDPKCYFGAMKPGEGKVHKECATLCIAGGIPPMFLVRKNGSAPDYYLIADHDGNGAGPAILPYVADPVEVSAELEQCGDLRILKLDPAALRRL